MLLNDTFLEFHTSDVSTYRCHLSTYWLITVYFLNLILSNPKPHALWVSFSISISYFFNFLFHFQSHTFSISFPISTLILFHS